MTLNHLILILDCSISDAFMQNILIFLNSFTSRTGNEILLLSSENAIFQSFQGRPEWISADRINTESADRIKTDNAGKIWYRFRNMNAAVISNIQKYIVDGKPSKIAKSLALGLLCKFCLSIISILTPIDSNKVLKTPMQANAKFRFLVFSDSSDQADDHIAFMNCVFAAQRKDIPIDICRLTSAKSLYLPQAASLTKGVYMVIDKNNELIHVLMVP